MRWLRRPAGNAVPIRFKLKGLDTRVKTPRLEVHLVTGTPALIVFLEKGTKTD